jgi:hypothetical protein
MDYNIVSVPDYFDVATMNARGVAWRIPLVEERLLWLEMVHSS